jgi:hypothetical protein
MQALRSVTAGDIGSWGVDDTRGKAVRGRTKATSNPRIIAPEKPGHPRQVLH